MPDLMTEVLNDRIEQERAVKRARITNFEHIKNMSTEKLAIFLNEWSEKPVAWKRDLGETLAWLTEEADNA